MGALAGDSLEIVLGVELVAGVPLVLASFFGPLFQCGVPEVAGYTFVLDVLFFIA